MLLPIDSRISFGEYIDQLIRYAEYVDLDTTEYDVTQYRNAACNLVERALGVESVAQYEEAFVWLWRSVHIFRSLGSTQKYTDVIEKAMMSIERVQKHLRKIYELHLLRIQEEEMERRACWEKRWQKEILLQQQMLFDEEDKERTEISRDILQPINKRLERVALEIRRAALIERKMTMNEELKEKMHLEKMEREKQLQEIRMALQRRNEEKRREQQRILEKFTNIKRSTIPRLTYKRWAYPIRTPSAGRRGLVNLGNTCFMNSVLQCLQTITILRNSIQARARKIAGSQEQRTAAPLTTAYAWVSYELEVRVAQHATSPNFLHRIIQSHDATFDNYSQQDSHEFLRMFLDILQQEAEMLQGCGGASSQTTQGNGTCSLSPATSFPDVVASYCKQSDTIISRTFGYFERSSLLCPKCGHDSITYSISFALILPIPRGAQTLHDCLSLYTASEALPLDAGWVCSNCKEVVAGIKQLTFETYPHVLVITLVRFCASVETGTYEKNNTEIVYPLSLTLHGHEYDLTSVVNHQGTMTGGHYTADVCNPDDRAWYTYSDERFFPVHGEPKWSQSYILFYRSRNSKLSGLSICSEENNSVSMAVSQKNTEQHCVKMEVSDSHITNGQQSLNDPHKQQNDLDILEAWLNEG